MKTLELAGKNCTSAKRLTGMEKRAKK